MNLLKNLAKVMSQTWPWSGVSEMPMAPRMYILVRKDLSDIYGCVQGTHALAQYAVEHPEEFRLWNNGYLIFLGVRFPKEIREWEERLTAAGKKFSVFSEPDQDGVKTAIACYDTGDIFCGLKIA